MMKYSETKEFERDLKKLSNKFRSLTEDLGIAKKNAIELFHLHDIDNGGIFEIKGVGNKEELKFYKIKKFACKSLPGRGVRSGIRIIYAYFPNKKEVVFLEIYFKSKQQKEKRERIFNFISSNQL